MNLVYVGLGSNLSNPEQQIKAAVKALAKHDSFKITKLSSLYFSRPMGPQDQPDYMNAVVELSTMLEPLALLEQLQVIENKAGRIRKENRWGARVLDLDILLFNHRIINSEKLTVPHYGLKEREFVVIPLAEITKELTLPDGTDLKKLAENITTNGQKIHSQLC